MVSYLEHRFGEIRGTQEYSFKVLALIDRIRSERPELAANVRQDRHGVRIMSDAEADQYTGDDVVRRYRGAMRVTKRRATIDRREFSAEERAIAENRDRVFAEMAVATRKALIEAERRKRIEGK